MTSFLANEYKDRLLSDLNMTLEMIFIPWDQYWDKKEIMFASQEPVDLYWDGLPNLSTMTNRQQAQPIGDLVETYCQDMLKVLPMSHIQGGMINGVLYGIPSSYAVSSGMYQFVCVRDDILKDVGMSGIATPQDLHEFAKLATEKYDHILGGADPMVKPLTRFYAPEQYTWLTYEFLVVFGEESHKAYSYYETDAFKEICKFNRMLNDEGLYTDEVTLNYNERDTRVQSGNYLWQEGSFGKHTEIVDLVRANAPEAVMQNYLLAPEKPRYINAAGGEVLCVPYSSQNPAAGMKLLNWLYSNQDNYLFSIYGVEGQDYEMQGDRLQRLINDEMFYEWMFRNKHYTVFSPEADDQYVIDYSTWDNTAKVSEMFGFVFNNENVKETEQAIIEVYPEMTPVFTGFVDFDTSYEPIIAKLKSAGLDKYVDEVNRQLEEFFANK
jgi:ABC-type glycerol-3-phosphate transport system substrate-binding protein